MHLRDKLQPFAKAVTQLLRTDVDQNHKVWSQILQYQVEIQEYVNQIGLELIVHAEDGYAYLRQFEVDDDGATIGLVHKRQLSYEVSIILILLREMYETYEMNPTEVQSAICRIQHVELKDQAELFFKEGYNRVKFLRDIDKHINKAVDLGFLKSTEQGESPQERVYEIKPIIKAKINIDQLSEFKQKLEAHMESV